jgi:site-specific recombinase XerD
MITEYLEYARREQGRSAGTVYKYGISMRGLASFLATRGVHLLDASADDLRPWVHAVLVRDQANTAGLGMPPAPATVKRRVAELRSLYKYLHEVRGVVPYNPARRLAAPTVHNENPRPVPDGIWRSLWNSDLCDSDRVGFGLAYFCGLRRHEVTLLEPAHFVDVPKPILSNFKRKGGAKRNLPWLSCVRIVEQRRPDLIGGSARTFTDALERVRTARADRPTLLDWQEIAPKPRGNLKYPIPADYVNPQYLYRHLRKALAAAGMPADTFTPHQMRHSFCTNLLDMGVPLLAVSRLAGHSSLAVTQRYLATREDPLEDMLTLDACAVEPKLQLSGPWQ